MLMKCLELGDKCAKYPVIQGGMGVGVSLSQLAGAVAHAGGVGVISSAQIGFDEPDFKTNTREANIRALTRHIKNALAMKREGLVGVNVMVALKDYREHVRTAAQAGADIIISGAGLPVDLPELVAGTGTKIAPIVSTERSAAVILKYWDRKYHRTADLVVIEGPKAGGHLGFSREQLEEYAEYDDKEYITTMNFVKNNIKIRNKFSFKSDFGKVTIFAGATGFTGAAYLSSESAVKCGSGLVTVICDKEIQPILSCKLSEAMTANYMKKKELIN